MRHLLMVMGLAGVMAIHGLGAGPAPAGNADLVITAQERWIDTVQGRIKNFSSTKAYDTTLIILFVNAKGKVMGRQAVKVGDLDSGEERSFSAPIPEEYRKEVRTFLFEPKAIWRKRR